MPSWKKVITSGSDASLNSLYSPSITGSLHGTASYANYALSASYALTASYSKNLQVSGSVNNVDYIDFNTGSATPAWQSGRVFWDNTDGCLAVYNVEQDVTLQVGQENWTRIYNPLGTTVTNGTVVRLSGTHGDVPEIERAQSFQVSGSVNALNQILGVATHDIEAGTFGYITTQGLVRGLNTNAFNDGDTLFVGTGSAGALQNSAPIAPYEIIPVGVCVKASPGGSGIIYVAVQQPIDFSDLSAVLVQGTYHHGDLWSYISSGSSGVWTHTNQLSGSYGVTGSWSATSFTGSLRGTASYATTALSSSFAATASYITTLNQNVLITGSATIASTAVGASENTLTLGPSPAGGSGEGGQLGLNAPGGTYTSASMIDNYQNQIRILRGTNASSTGLVAQWNLHTLQMQLPAYTAASSFAGTAAANLAVDSSGNVITVSTSGGTVFPYTGNAVITGSLTTTGAIYAQANGAMYFQGGDDAALYDINVANTMGVYGVQDSTIGSIKLGSGGGTISGKSNRIGIGTTNPTNGTLEVNGNVYATSFTGSLFGTASYATTVLSSSFASTASYIQTAQTASYVLQAVSSSYALSASYAPSTPAFPYTGSAEITGSLGVTGSFKVQTYDAFISNAFVNAIQLTDTNRTLYDVFGNTSIDVGARFLVDNTSNPSLGWLSRTMFDSTTAQSIDWGNRLTYDGSGTATSLDWNNRVAFDATGNTSIDWSSRELGTSGGDTSVTWDYPTQAQAVEFNSYTRKIIPLGTVVETFSNLPVYATFNPDGEILKGVNFDSTVADFDLVYLNTDNKWYPVDVTTSSSSKLLGIAWGVGTGKEKVLIEGTMIVNDSALTDSPQVIGVDHGLPIYIKTGTGTYMSTSAPGTSGNYVRVLGHAYYQGVADSNYWVMKFRPANDWYVI